MASLTIPDLDDDVARQLEAIARANGRSAAEEAREWLTATAFVRKPAGAEQAEGFLLPPGQPERPLEEQERIRRLLDSVGRKPDEPFDQKAFTDELWSFVE